MIFSNIKNIDECLESIKYLKKNYHKNEIIFNELDICDSIAYIINGSIKAIKSYSDGHNSLIKKLSKYDCIGINLVFSKNPIYKADFICEEDSTILIIKKEDLITLMRNNTIIMNNVLEDISNSAVALNEHIKMLSFKTVKERILAYLYQEYLKTNSLSFTIELSKTELASFLNVERPSLSTEISKLIKDGIILNDNKKYIIKDIKLLEKSL